MEYTRESIYSEIGRYNSTVIVGLKTGAIENVKYGNVIIGRFLYSNKERSEMTRLIRDSNGVKTHGNIRFKYSDETGISKEQIIELRRFGISTESISNLNYINFSDSEDLYIQGGIKEVPTLNIPIPEDSPKNFIHLMLGIYHNKRRNAWKFLDEEIAEFIGLELLVRDNIVPELLEEYEIDEKSNLNDRIDYYNLRATFWLMGEKMSLEKKERLNELSAKYTWEVFSEFKSEIGFTGSNVDFLKEYQDLAITAYYYSMKFKPERLVESDPAVWWDVKSFVHIMCRHAHEFENEKFFKDKTRFQYEITEAIRVIKIVCKMVYDDFVKSGSKEINREGMLAIEYNGNYYCLRINSSGKLCQFYPYKKDI
jgi:hypothetical protein